MTKKRTITEKQKTCTCPTGNELYSGGSFGLSGHFGECFKPEPEGWEDRFDSAFFYLEGSGEGPEKARVVNENDVKSFIRNLLREEKERLITKIKKLL